MHKIGACGVVVWVGGCVHSGGSTAERLPNSCFGINTYSRYLPRCVLCCPARSCSTFAVCMSVGWLVAFVSPPLPSPTATSAGTGGRSSFGLLPTSVGGKRSLFATHLFSLGAHGLEMLGTRRAHGHRLYKPNDPRMSAVSQRQGRLSSGRVEF